MNDNEIIGLAITLVISALGGYVIHWAKFKVRFGNFRKLIDLVDNAIQDDKVTEPEFRGIWSSFKTVFT